MKFRLVDIEGSEHRAINGMKEPVLRCQPVMVIELLKAHRSTFLDILPFLTDAGYEIYQCPPDALLHVEPTVEALKRAQAINFLAVTRDNQFLPLLGLDTPLPRNP